MDSQSAPVVSASKLPTLNPNEFDLWKIRIEQYFLMTDYSLWEVIINGDSVISRVAVDGVAQPVTVLTAEQKLARKNELKAHGTLLMALSDKHQLKFNSHKDAKTLMEAIEKHQIHDRLQKLVSQLEIHGVSLSQEDVNLKFLRSLPSEWKTHTLIWRNKANLEEHSLDDLFNNLKIYETEVRHSSSPSNLTQNLAFVSSSNTDSTTDSVSAATSVFAVCAKLPMSSHQNIDSLSNATGRNFGDNRVTTMGFDMSKVECYNCHKKGYFARECRSPKDTKRLGGAEPHRRTAPSYQIEEEPANFALMVIPSSSSSDNEAALESVESRLVMYKQNESIFQENIIVLKNEVEARDNFILTLKQKLKQVETERDDLKLKFEKFQSSSKSLTELIASQTNNKHGLGYLSSEDDSESVSLTCPSDRLSPSGGYHAVPPPIIGNFMPPKPYLVFNTAPLAVESDHSAFNVKVSPAKPAQAISHTTKSMAPIIEDWVSDSEDEFKPNDPYSVFVQPIEVPILTATSNPTIKTGSSGKRKNRKPVLYA
nr:hypothetical protein [Tanacetum cinerariifolium]